MREILECHSEHHARGVYNYLFTREGVHASLYLQTVWATFPEGQCARGVLPVVLWRGTRRVGVQE
jgi:hypothetical protein